MNLPLICLYSTLIDVFRYCEVRYIAPVSPDQCWDAVRSCNEENSNTELDDLCEKGPANYINISGTVYRNQFCSLCHGIDLSSVEDQYLDLPRPPEEAIQFIWKDSKLVCQEASGAGVILMIARPKVSKDQQILSSKSSKGNNFASTIDLVCYFFANPIYDFCPNTYYVLTNKDTSQEHDPPVWDLASLHCYSPHPKVCDLFIKASSESKECGKVGCKNGQLLDMETMKCMSPQIFSSRSPIYKEDLSWHAMPLCSYKSRCKAVDLGLIAQSDLNCFCDKFCVYFNDCCEDSPFRNDNSSLPLTPGTFSCASRENSRDSHIYKQGFYYTFMEVDKCPYYYANTTVINKCECSLFGECDRFSLVNIPVTDLNTGLR